MPAKFKSRNKRKRNKSSPGSKNSQIDLIKRQRSNLTSDTETETEYLSAFSDDSDFSDIIKVSNKPSMAMCTKQDLEEVVSKMLTKDKADLIFELKNELKSEFERVIEVKTEHLNLETLELRHEVENLRNCVKTANAENDDLEQYGRRMMLTVSDIPGDTGDAQEDVEKKILEYATDKLEIDLTATDIDKTHRLGKYNEEFVKNRRVIIKFTNSKAHQRAFNARKSTQDGIFIQESLTRKRENLAYEARKLKRESKLEKTWIAGGNIFGSMLINGEETKVSIKSMQAIQQIRDGIVPQNYLPTYP